MRTTTIHVDTANPNRCITKVNGNPFNCTYKMSQTHRRLKGIRLLNAQIPVGFYNIRSPYNVIVIDNTPYTIDEGNYTIESLISALNTEITSGVGEFSLLSTNRVQFDPSGTSTIQTEPTSSYPIITSGYDAGIENGTLSTPATTGSLNYKLTPMNLAKLLGFRNNPSGTTIIATNSYLINFDTYLNIYIPNIGTSSSETDLCSFKIPIIPTANTVSYWSENSQNCQFLHVSDSSCIVDRLNIEIYDRFGNIMNNGGLDWSMSLEIESLT